MRPVGPDRLGRLGRAVRHVVPDWRDVHVYGGGLLIAAALDRLVPGTGPIAYGVLLLYLGLRRPAS